MIRVDEYKWYSGRTTVGFVLCYDSVTHESVCYTGCGNGMSEAEDVEFIKNWGARVEKDVAEAVFGVDIDEYKGG